MSAGQLWLALLSSAAVGALVSSLLLAFDHWRERAARKRELLFSSALEISKATAKRLAETSEKFVPAAELAILPKAYEIAKEVYETGKMSESNKVFMESFLKRKE
jgi:hypothetical protein